MPRVPKGTWNYFGLHFQSKKLILLFLSVNYKSIFWDYPRNYKKPLNLLNIFISKPGNIPSHALSPELSSSDSWFLTVLSMLVLKSYSIY